jgi:anti-sigma regulatory factor (Ser/Thr protein kinase)
MSGKADSSPTIRIELLSRPDLLAPVRAMVVSLAERFGFDDVESGHLALAVDEALANVIRHGYESRTDGRIWIAVHLIESPVPTVRIEIEDEGRQVDPALINPRDLDDIRPGGLGVHIMREVTDACDFEARQPRGMRLVLEKIPRHRHPQDHGDAPEPPSSPPNRT